MSIYFLKAHRSSGRSPNHVFWVLAFLKLLKLKQIGVYRLHIFEIFIFYRSINSILPTEEKTNKTF